jgi:hypothetical protein
VVFTKLSEKEMNQISSILDSENIPYQVLMDEQELEQNKEKAQKVYNKRKSINYSNTILSIQMDQSDFETLSDNAKEKLLPLGITTQIPEGLFEESQSEKIVKKENLFFVIIKKLFTIGFLLFALYGIFSRVMNP